jgi:hypothetical protein
VRSEEEGGRRKEDETDVPAVVGLSSSPHSYLLTPP